MPPTEPTPLPDAASPWELAPRVRRLAHDLQQKIIDRCREEVRVADKAKQAAETHAMNALTEARGIAQARFAEAQGDVTEMMQQLQEAQQVATAHVAAQKVTLGNQENSSTGLPPGADAVVTPDGVSALIQATNDAQTRLLALRMPVNLTNFGEGGRGCALLIAGLVAGIVLGAMAPQGFGFLTFLLFTVGVPIAVIVMAKQSATAKLSRAYWDFHRKARKLHGALHVQTEDAFRLQEVRAAEAVFKAAVDTARAAHDAALARCRRWVEPVLQSMHREFDRLETDAGLAGADWTNPDWQDWAPPDHPMFAARFGYLQAETADLGRVLPFDWDFALPALVPFPEDRSLLFDAGGAAKDRAARAVQAAVARLLATVPPGKLRLTFIDPLGLGSNAAAFMPLGDHDESLINSRAWSEPAHIEQRLANLTEHMETVIQKYLRAEYRTIQEYNQAAREVAEPYRFVVVFDFPQNFTDTAARRLVSIVRNGARCGVYVLVVRDPALALPYGFQIEELARACACVVVAPPGAPGVGTRWHDPDFQPWRLELDEPAPSARLDAIIATTGARAKEAMRVEVPYERLLALSGMGDEPAGEPGPAATTARSIRIPLGLTGARKVQYLTLGEGTGHHGLIVGRPGSGKSNLMHVIITTGALLYPPDELRLYLIDFKKGVEFKKYAEFLLPHAEAIAVESEREFGLSVIERIDLELKERGDRFRRAQAVNITEFRQKTGGTLPRVLLIVDEFQEFFTQDDNIARQTALILDRLVRQGRAFGLHVLLGSQTLAGSQSLANSTLDQMGVRIAMQCSEADSHRILSDGNSAARLLSRPGEAIYNDAAGLLEGNKQFQVANFTDHDRDERLAQIGARAHAHAEASGQPAPVPMVFEGNEPAPLEGCRPLCALLAAGAWPTGKPGVELLLGDPVAIHGPVTARLRRQSGSHLLLLSRDEEEGTGLCAAVLLSILTQCPPDAARIIVADFASAETAWPGRLARLAGKFPHDVKVVRKQREVAEAVRDLAAEVKRRGQETVETPACFLLLQGMQRIKVLRTEDDAFSYDGGGSATPSEFFAEILREGPEVGVHVVGWCDTYTNACRVADRRMMNEFGLRAGGIMSADDSMSYFDEAAASRLDKPHRMLFFDEEHPGQLEKFRPYSCPGADWLDDAVAALRERGQP